MVKLIWGYVFQEVITENDTLDVIKTSRFDTNLKIHNNTSFKDTRVWYLNTSEDGLNENFNTYSVNLELWNRSPG